MSGDLLLRIRRHGRARALLIGALLGLAGLLVVLAFLDLDRARVRRALREILPSMRPMEGVEAGSTGAVVAAALLVLCAEAARRGLRWVRWPLGLLLLLPPVGYLLAQATGGPAPARWLSTPLRTGQATGPLGLWIAWAVVVGAYLHALARGAFDREPPGVSDVFA